ncbi:hypothetical protein HK096_009203 [Nowakowskiella sp. JEL0078]|nr:hypothetical protein HK096_009203 [Nowakowskiella sp. JEL0078]
MCHPPNHKHFQPEVNKHQGTHSNYNNNESRYQPKSHVSLQTSGQSQLPSFKELFLSTTFASTQKQTSKCHPVLKINTNCVEYTQSSITIPVDSEDENYITNGLHKSSRSPDFDSDEECDLSPSPVMIREIIEEIPQLSASEKRLEFAERLVGILLYEKLSSKFNSLIDLSAALIESIWPPTKTASSYGIPPLRTFVQEFLRRSHSSFSNLQLALFYLVRLNNRLQKKGIVLNPKAKNTMNDPFETEDFCRQHECIEMDFGSQQKYPPALRCGRRMFLAALILSCKYLSDKPPSNQAWAQLSGLSLSEINDNERAFLGSISFDSHVVYNVYVKWTQLLLRFIETSSVFTQKKLTEIDATNHSNKHENVSSAASSPTTLYLESTSSRGSSPSFIESRSKNVFSDEETDYDSEDENPVVDIISQYRGLVETPI